MISASSFLPHGVDAATRTLAPRGQTLKPLSAHKAILAAEETYAAFIEFARERKFDASLETLREFDRQAACKHFDVLPAPFEALSLCAFVFALVDDEAIARKINLLRLAALLPESLHAEFMEHFSLCAPTGKQAMGVYGFARQRQNLIDHLHALGLSRFFDLLTIDECNRALGVEIHWGEQGQQAIEHCLDVICRIRKGSLTMERQDFPAPEMLKKWAAFLTSHADKIDVLGALRKKVWQSAQPDRVLLEFIRKNAHGATEIDAALLQEMEKMLAAPDFSTKRHMLDVRALTDRIAEEKKVALGDMFQRAFFRRTSKLGMAFHAGEGIPLIFKAELYKDYDDARLAGEGMDSSLAARDVRLHKYRISDAISNGMAHQPWKENLLTGCAHPITHSELRKLRELPSERIKCVFGDTDLLEVVPVSEPAKSAQV